MSRQVAARVITKKKADYTYAETATMTKAKKDRIVTEALDKPYEPSLTEKIAGHRLFFKNWMIPGGQKHFPNEPWLRCVDRYFPHAEGGPLFIDIIETKNDAREFARKTTIMATLKLRYLVMTPGMKYNEAMEALDK